jgi:hypothetical protein
MDALSDTSLLIALWSLAGVVLTATCLPPLLGLLGFMRFWTEFDDNPSHLEPDAADESYADAHRQLTALGFAPLGVFWEKTWFLAHHWFKSFEVKSFASKTHGCFGQVYRLLPGDTVRVFLATCFEDGTYIVTANHMEEFVINQGGYYRWGVETSDLSAVLEHHQKMVEQLGAGRMIKAPSSLQVLMATMTPHNDRYLRSDRSISLNSLCAGLMEPGIAAALAVSVFGVAHPLVPVALLIGCVRKACLQSAMLWQVARERNLRIVQEKQGLA